MKIQISLHSYFMLFILVILLSSNNLGKGNIIDGYVGSISDDEIQQGDTLVFTGSIYNLNNESIYLYSMNTTFIELLGQSSVRDPQRFEYNKAYKPAEEIISNGIVSDNFESKIDLNPGKYNVSIGFGWANGSLALASDLGTVYSVVNQTVEVFGTSQSVNIARGIGYFLLGVVGLIIIYWLYSKIRS
ncbi:MAG: hypothetical protein ACW99A_02620 [Candidatus Kariarchaeaceae archaeon]|jgi:hypothetical protein